MWIIIQYALVNCVIFVSETNRMNNEAPVLPPGGARSSNRRNTHTSPERALRINTGQATKLVCLYDFQVLNMVKLT